MFAGEISETPTTTVQGRVVATGVVTVVEWDQGPGTPRKSAKLDKAQDGATPFQCEVTLKPGPHRIKVIVTDKLGNVSKLSVVFVHAGSKSRLAGRRHH